ncbi:hypothetical protein SAMN05660479_01707 [Microbulbifer thermotolerans]|nr:hypothetical protein SAMN05660479_01707 [Microbulbifer thermotolerans]
MDALHENLQILFEVKINTELASLKSYKFFAFYDVSCHRLSIICSKSA